MNAPGPERQRSRLAARLGARWPALATAPLIAVGAALLHALVQPIPFESRALLAVAVRDGSAARPPSSADLSQLAGLVGGERAEGAAATIETVAPNRLRLAATASDPALAQRTVEALAATLAAAAGNLTPERPPAVRDRLAGLTKALAEAEARLRAASVGIDRAAAERRAAEERRAEALERDLAQGRIRAAEARARLAQAETVSAGRAEAEPGEGPSSPVLDRLRLQLAEALRAEIAAKTTLGPLHPQVREAEQQTRTMRRLLSAEVRRTVLAAETEVKAAEAEVRSFEQALARARPTSDAASARFGELEREVERRRQAVAEAEAEAGRSGERFELRILDRASPPAAVMRPLGPRLFLALCGGLAVSVMLALIPWPRRTAAEPDERAAPAETRPLDPPTLLALPSERWGTEPDLLLPPPRDRVLAVATGAASPYAQAALGLRRGLSAATPPGRSATVLVTEEAPGLGAAALAASLAQAYAEVGRRALLIDAVGGLSDALPRAAEPLIAPEGFEIAGHGFGFALLDLTPLAREPSAGLAVARMARSSFPVTLIAAGAEAAFLATLADRVLHLSPAEEPGGAALRLLSPRVFEAGLRASA